MAPESLKIYGIRWICIVLEGAGGRGGLHHNHRISYISIYSNGFGSGGGEGVDPQSVKVYEIENYCFRSKLLLVSLGFSCGRLLVGDRATLCFVYSNIFFDFTTFFVA